MGTTKMSTSAYYNFMTAGAGDKTTSLLPISTRSRQGPTSASASSNSSGSGSSHDLATRQRRSTLSSSPFATNSSASFSSSSTSNTTSSSSLNQYNSPPPPPLAATKTTTTTTATGATNRAHQESLSSCSSTSVASSASSAAGRLAAASTSNHLQQRDLYTRKSSISSSPQHHHSITTTPPTQMFHSYTLHSLEPKPFKPFKTKSDYIEAMKEDLAEWLNQLYPDLELTPDNLFSQLETGSIICRHANNVTLMGRNLIQDSSPQQSFDQSHSFHESSYGSISEPNNNNINNTHSNSSSSSNNNNNNINAHNRANSNSPMSSASSNDFSLCSSTSSSTNVGTTKSGGAYHHQLASPRPSISSLSHRTAGADINWFWVKMIPYKEQARPSTFFARDNICQFILWCRSLNILECLLFETDDLVARKNEKSFILCLLEVARIGFKVGMPTPLIIQLEQEIDREIEEEAKLEAEKLQLNRSTTTSRPDGENCEDNADLDHPSDRKTSDAAERENVSAKVEEKEEEKFEKKLETSLDDDELTKQSEEDEAVEEEEEEEEEDYGPKPQVITNDLVSLHERVVQLLCQCTCPTQFPMVRVGDNGKYKIGDKLIIFVRILRRHIMVRVGGGWQELSEFLRAKDPCRSKLSFNHSQHHHQSTASVVSQTGGSHHHQNFANKHLHGSQTIRQASFSAAPRSRLLLDGRPSTTTAGTGNHLSRATVQRSNSPAPTPRSNSRHRFISGSASMSWISNNS